MARLTIRLSDDFHDRLLASADAVGMTAAAYAREALERTEGSDPFGFHARFDELQSTAIQIVAILATDVGKRAPDSLERAMVDTKRLLGERGLAPQTGSAAS